MTGKTDRGSKEAAMFSIHLEPIEKSGPTCRQKSRTAMGPWTFPAISPLMRPPSMKRLEPLIARRTNLLLRRSVVGSISNRGRNYEPARLRSFCGQQNLKSHSVPRLIGGACRCMAAHVVRLPRLTLKAGRRAGYKEGSPRDERADRGKTQKSKFESCQRGQP